MQADAPGTLSQASAITRSTGQLITGIASNLLGGLKPVSLEIAQDGETTQFILKVAAADLERIVGDQGRTMHSLQIIVRAAGIKHGLRFEFLLEQQAKKKLVSGWGTDRHSLQV